MAQDGKCGIYGFRNSLNGKWYIGQSVNIKERIRSLGFKNLKLYKDSII